MFGFIFTTVVLIAAVRLSFDDRRSQLFRRRLRIRELRDLERKKEEFLCAVRLDDADEAAEIASGLDSGALQEGLRAAVERGSFRSAKMLLEAGAVATESLFAEAVEADDYETARTLLVSEHIDYDRAVEKLRRRVDDRSLARCAEYGDLERLEDLLRRGYDPRVAASGETPLLFARDAEIARALVAAGADANARGPRGTPLDYALERPLGTEEARMRARLVAFLLENGAEPTAVPRNARSAFSTLAAAGKFMSDPEPAYGAVEKLLSLLSASASEEDLKFYRAYKEMIANQDEVYV